MSNPASISIAEECISEFNLMRSAPEATRPKFIIFKITDDNQRIVVEESSSDKIYNTFISKLWCAGNPYQSAPRYAVYDMEYEFGHEGRRTKTVFIHWDPSHSPLKQSRVYAGHVAQLKEALGLDIVIYADCWEELEWSVTLQELSEGLGLGEMIGVEV